MFQQAAQSAMIVLIIGGCATPAGDDSISADAASVGNPADAHVGDLVDARLLPPGDASYPDAPVADSCGLSCDDSQACTTDSCIDGVCVHTGESLCPWPAEPAANSVNLSNIPGESTCYLGFSIKDNDFSANLSGAVWNSTTQTLWLVVNNPGTLFAARPNGDQWALAQQDGRAAKWELAGLGDAEAVTQVDFNQGQMVYTLNESGVINQWDTTDFADVKRVRHWQLPEISNGNGGGEGLTFVPDSFLLDQGFVDSNGQPYVSVNGMGGLMFVGFQGNGDLFVYDLDPNVNTGVTLVGRYKTGGNETAGLEFDRSTGNLLIWHGGNLNQLEVTTLASTPTGQGRVMNQQVRYDTPALTFEMSSNIEGVAVAPVSDCINGRRRLWLLTDGGDCFSLAMYQEFPC